MRHLLTAEVLSVVGDQLAKVALSLLVYQRTGSAALTALTYALTLLPDLVAGPLLGPMADRFPRREVMVFATAFQAISAGIMAIPGVPLAIIGMCVVCIATAQAPFKAAQRSIVPNIVGEDSPHRPAVVGWLMTIRETGQLAGLAVGAGVVAWAGLTTALALNALSFVAAAILISSGLRSRPAARTTATPGSESEPAPMVTGWSVLSGNARLRALVAVYLLAGLGVLPEAIIVPLAAELAAPNWAVGLLMAADPAGFVVGSIVLNRTSRTRSQQATHRLIGWGATACLAPLLLFVFPLHPIAAGALLFVSGAAASYMIPGADEINRLTPDQVRGAVNGLIRTGLRAGQGVAAILGGLVVEWSGSASWTIAGAGTLGVVLAVFGALRWARSWTNTETDSAVTE